MVGPRGVKLSGGQIQRTAAARMFVRQPDLLVIDDLSSTLETERTLWERLFALRDVTCLVVSHRRVALRRASHIISSRTAGSNPNAHWATSCKCLPKCSASGRATSRRNGRPEIPCSWSLRTSQVNWERWPEVNANNGQQPVWEVRPRSETSLRVQPRPVTVGPESDPRRSPEQHTRSGSDVAHDCSTGCGQPPAPAMRRGSARREGVTGSRS